MRWTWREKQAVGRLLEARGWERDGFSRRPGYPVYRKKKLLASYDDARTLTITRIEHEETAFRRTTFVAFRGPCTGRGWATALADAVDAAFNAYYDGEAP